MPGTFVIVITFSLTLQLRLVELFCLQIAETEALMGQITCLRSQNKPSFCNLISLT